MTRLCQAVSVALSCAVLLLRSDPAPVAAVAAQLKQATVQDRTEGDVSKLSKAQRQRLRKKMRETGQE